jgi:hypothetical protein
MSQPAPQNDTIDHCYLFNKACLQFPTHLKTIVPREVLIKLDCARQAATTAFHSVRQLDKMWCRRYRNLCPVDDESRYRKHVESVDHLLRWERNHLTPWQALTLSPPPKIPLFLIHLYVDESTYNKFAKEYARIHNNFIEGPYARWVIAKESLDVAFEVGLPNEMNRRQCLRWWHRFLMEMSKWEDRIDELALPPWSEILQHLDKLLQEGVETESDWDADLSLHGS